jgi:hypothetical protein
MVCVHLSTLSLNWSINDTYAKLMVALSAAHDKRAGCLRCQYWAIFAHAECSYVIPFCVCMTYYDNSQQLLDIPMESFDMLKALVEQVFNKV